MILQETQIPEFGCAIISDAGGYSFILRNSKAGPLFRCKTDAYDWAVDTCAGAVDLPGYDIKPECGPDAALILLAMSIAYKAQTGVQA